MRKAALAARKSSFPKSCLLDRKRVSSDCLGRGISGSQTSECCREVTGERELFCHWCLLNWCSWWSFASSLLANPWRSCLKEYYLPVCKRKTPLRQIWMPCIILSMFIANEVLTFFKKRNYFLFTALISVDSCQCIPVSRKNAILTLLIISTMCQSKVQWK